MKRLPSIKYLIYAKFFTKCLSIPTTPLSVGMNNPILEKENLRLRELKWLWKSQSQKVSAQKLEPRSVWSQTLYCSIKDKSSSQCGASKLNGMNSNWQKSRHHATDVSPLCNKIKRIFIAWERVAYKATQGIPHGEEKLKLNELLHLLPVPIPR